MRRYVHLRPRLEAAAGLLPTVETIADIGCDHGRLTVGLLQKNIAKRVIAADISENALERARALVHITGQDANVDFRVGDGLNVLAQGEAQAIALCGMGGMLIARILGDAQTPLMGAELIVLQPMRGVAELRRYIYAHGLRIVRDVVACDKARMYQVFSIAPGMDTPPPGWPEDFFLLGFHAIGDPLFPALAKAMLMECEKGMISARGSRGEARLRTQASHLRSILLRFT